MLYILNSFDDSMPMTVRYPSDLDGHEMEKNLE